MTSLHNANPSYKQNKKCHKFEERCQDFYHITTITIYYTIRTKGTEIY